MCAPDRQHPRPRDPGFSLIELLVVVIIVGLLAAIATPIYLNQHKKAVDASIKADIKALATAAETLATENPTATTYGDTAADRKAAFEAVGFKESPGNELLISGAPAHGFCIIGKNVRSGSTPSTHYFWYDSGNGGTPAGPPSSAYPLSGGMACTNPFLIAHDWWTSL